MNKQQITDEQTRLQSWIGKSIVVDSFGDVVYIGELDSFDSCFISLGNVDICNIQTLNTTKEKHVHNAKKFGLNPNRKNIVIYKHQILSLSLMSDIIEF